MVRTRFAPSPTGQLHIGNLRTAIYAYAMAKHFQGNFILRIEDTDQKREVVGGVESIKNILTTFGLNWDEYYVQSERKAAGIYQKAAEKLVSTGHAFYCQCQGKNAKEEGFSNELRDPCRNLGLTSGAIKLKVPENEIVSYHDFVLDKEVSWNTNTVYDATLLKSDGFPTYHLAAMTDDLDMHISHILRGHDWMPSTPIHLLVFKYLSNNQQPEIGHLSDIQSPKGGKLSKRRDAVFCEAFLEQGYLPEALINFVILLGWAPKDNRELFTLSEFVSSFDTKGFQKSNPLFTYNKLDWFNGSYIRQKSNTEIATLVKPYMKTDSYQSTKIEQIIPLVKDRLTKLSDFPSLASFFFVESQDLNYDLTLFPPSAKTCLSSALEVIKSSAFDLTSLSEHFVQEISKLQVKTGEYFMNLRVALTGVKFTPPITESMLVLGKDETLARLTRALTLL